MSHTPTPWELGHAGVRGFAGEQTVINRSGGFPRIARVFGRNITDDAAFIVRAVNSHADLLEALEDLCDFVGEVVADANSINFTDRHAWGQRGEHALTKAHTAIAK